MPIRLSDARANVLRFSAGFPRIVRAKPALLQICPARQSEGSTARRFTRLALPPLAVVSIETARSTAKRSR